MATNGVAIFDHQQSHRIHVWYIYLHLAKIYGKCDVNVGKYNIPYLDPMGIKDSRCQLILEYCDPTVDCSEILK